MNDETDEGPERPRAPARAAVRFTAALGRAICARLASGESQLSICAEPGMPSRSTLWRWTRERPAFARQLATARAAGGVARANGRCSSFCQATADEIFRRLCEGESLTGICRDPAMPAFSTVYYWRRQFPDFAAAMQAAREIQAERFCDLGWEIAEGVTPETARAAQVKLGQLRWTAAVLAPTRYGRMLAVMPEGGAKEQIYLFRHFKAEPDETGKLQVVTYIPTPGGEVVRIVRSKGETWTPPAGTFLV